MQVSDLKEDRWLFTVNGKDVWRVKYWFNEPTVCLVNLDTGVERAGGVDSLNMKPFIPLIPQKPMEGKED